MKHENEKRRKGLIWVGFEKRKSSSDTWIGLQGIIAVSEFSITFNRICLILSSSSAFSFSQVCSVPSFKRHTSVSSFFINCKASWNVFLYPSENDCKKDVSCGDLTYAKSAELHRRRVQRTAFISFERILQNSKKMLQIRVPREWTFPIADSEGRHRHHPQPPVLTSRHSIMRRKIRITRRNVKSRCQCKVPFGWSLSEGGTSSWSPSNTYWYSVLLAFLEDSPQQTSLGAPKTRE